jgi:hypothetical protein
VHVGKVDLHDRHLDRGDRVAEGDRVVGERARVEDDAGEPLALRGLEPVDQLALVIRLPALDRVAAATRMIAEHAVDLRERDLAVHPGLAGAEQIQVGAVQHENFHARRELSISGRRRASLAQIGRPCGLASGDHKNVAGFLTSSRSSAGTPS